MSNRYSEIKSKIRKLLNNKQAQDDKEIEAEIDSLLQALDAYKAEVNAQNTELQEAGERFKQERDIADALYNNAPVAYLTVNSTGLILRMNKSAADMLRTSIHMSGNALIQNFIPRSSRNEFVIFLNEVFSTNTIIYDEQIVRQGRNQILYTRVQGRKLYDPGSSQDLALITLTDYTEQRLYRMQLAESEERFRTVFMEDKSPKMIIRPDNGKIIDANSAAHAFYGYPDLLRMELNQISVNDESEIKSLLSEACLRQKNYFSLKHLLANGSQKEVELYSSPIKIRNQNALFTIIHDVSERFEAEKAVNESYQEYLTVNEELKTANEQLVVSRERYRTLFESSNDPIVIHSIKGRILEVNGNFTKTFGYAGEDLYEQSIINFLPESENKAFAQNIHRLKQDKALRTQTAFYHKNGKIVNVEISAAFIDKEEQTVQAILRDITEQKAFEKSLIKSRAYNKRLAEASFEAIFFSENGICTDYNSQAQKLFGLNSAELIGKHLTILFRDEYKNLISEKIEKGEEKLYEAHAKRKNGEIFPCEIQARVVKQGNKRVRISALRDISRRKESEKALKNSEMKFRQLFENALDAIFIMNEKAEFIDCNHRAVEITGFSKNEIIGNTPQIFSAQYQADGKLSGEKVSKVHQAAMEGEVSRFEWLCRQKNGSPFTAEVSYFAFSEGKTKLMYAVVKDISESKRAQKALKASEQQKKRILNTSQNAIYIYDNSDLRYEYANPAFTKYTKWTPEDLNRMKEDFFSLFHEADFPRVQEHMDKVINSETDRSYAIEYRFKTKEGKFIWLYSQDSPYERDENGNVKKFIGAFTDISALKKIEDELTKSSKQLAELNATKDKFLSVIAHDLKSPFNAIIGFTKLLMNNHREYSETQKDEFLRIVYNSSENTYRLIENLLEWARSQSGRIEFNPQLHDLQTVLAENILLLMSQAEQKNISLKFDQKTEGRIYADLNMLNSVLRNLISNAIKFTPKGGEVYVGAEKKSDAFSVYVKDSGIGIDKETQNKLFNISEKVSSEGTEHEKGTGLGLILCRDFMLKHGGSISVNSKIGEGSVFSITFPYKKH